MRRGKPRDPGSSDSVKSASTARGSTTSGLLVESLGSNSVEPSQVNATGGGAASSAKGGCVRTEAPGEDSEASEVAVQPAAGPWYNSDTELIKGEVLRDI